MIQIMKLLHRWKVSSPNSSFSNLPEFQPFHCLKTITLIRDNALFVFEKVQESKVSFIAKLRSGFVQLRGT
jgi:hypothetical protein